jgi:hypothetical protein
MDAETVQEIALTSNLKSAKQAVNTLKKERNLRGLLEIINDLPVVALKVQAVKALGEVGSKRDAKALIDRLARLNIGLVSGGSDQQAEHRLMKKALVDAIAQLTKVRAPSDLNVAAVKTFIADSKRKAVA